MPGWRRFLSQFRDVLVILLLVATAVSVALWFVERDTALPYESIAIFAVVLLNATMGFIQESRAEAAVAALRAMSASEASVVRDGERRHVAATELVLLVQNRFGAAITMLVIGAGIASNIDNLIRPLIYRRVSHIHPMITLVGAFAGVKLFGLLGVLLGPLAIAFLFELLQFYRQEYGVYEGVTT